MALKRICDVCGEPINPFSSGTLVLMDGSYESFGRDGKRFDLCVSCAMKLMKFLDGKENEPWK